MKTIEVFILQKKYGLGYVICSITASKEEAYEWYNSSSSHDYLETELTLPQEIQVQRDY